MKTLNVDIVYSFTVTSFVNTRLCDFQIVKMAVNRWDGVSHTAGVLEAKSPEKRVSERNTSTIGKHLRKRDQKEKRETGHVRRESSEQWTCRAEGCPS